MDVKQAVEIAKQYVSEMFADEQISNLGLDETEYDEARESWVITLGFSRPWNSPRSRAQEVLENLGSYSSLRRAYKILTVAKDGKVLSMKNRAKAELND